MTANEVTCLALVISAFSLFGGVLSWACRMESGGAHGTHRKL
jgi:hypothetical protein